MRAEEWYFGGMKRKLDSSSDLLTVNFELIDYGGNVLSHTMPTRTVELRVDSTTTTLNQLQRLVAVETENPDVYIMESPPYSFPLTSEEEEYANVKNPAHTEWFRRKMEDSWPGIRQMSGEQRIQATRDGTFNRMEKAWLLANPEPPKYIIVDEDEAERRSRAKRIPSDIIGYQDGRMFEQTLYEINPDKYANGNTVTFTGVINTTPFTAPRDVWKTPRLHGLRDGKWPPCDNFDDVDVINQNGFRMETTEDFRRGPIDTYEQRVNLPKHVTVFESTAPGGKTRRTCVNRSMLIQYLLGRDESELFKNPATQVTSNTKTNGQVLDALLEAGRERNPYHTIHV